MNAFRFAQARDIASAMATVTADPNATYVAGGTNVIDLMKDGVERPALLVDITALPLRAIERTAGGVRLGSLALMSDVADHPAVASDFPAVAQALLLSASPQLRNMATIGGNVMQRTRCAYFRDVSQGCNKRAPGTGCAALHGVNRQHAVIGGSDRCICTHPSDLAVALLTVDAVVHVRGGSGERAIPIERFHVLPGATPERDTVLEHGELITAVDLPASALARGSYYLKVRDRASYEFALVSVAAALDVAGGTIRAARVALGGVAPKPWRSHDAEAALVGRQPGAEAFAAAARASTRGMRGYGQNDFKIELARRAVVRALEHAGGAA
ncbi:MAG: aromatic aldehyde oxidoreductase FAD-binding subunit [Candidatus Eremiobacteraeota bacterium]|nr:aromatic aldehyde oxidoreductase FAD-binding subunit [Candidatus Eremiobacteraeota bacterium]